MFLMVAEVLELAKLASKFPDNPVWQAIKFHTTHVEWVGCSLHDMIQPSFSFLVGVALPFSLANRLSRGDSFLKMTLHAMWRSLILILLGVFLRSTHSSMTNWTFEDTLTQIGLGYFFLYLLGWQKTWVAVLAFFAIVIGYWGAWTLYPAAGPDFISHWQKNANLGWAFDTWFLNLFPRKAPFTANSGGYLTLSFIPTLATMILGLMAGHLLQQPWEKWKQIGLCLVMGVAGIAIGYFLHEFDICPNVKRIWTPTWVFYSGGWCYVMLPIFMLLVDVLPLKKLFFPLMVFGVNSIAIYCLSHLIDGFIRTSLYTHFGKGFFRIFGERYEELFMGFAILLILWLILYWMYRRKLFLKI
ncbi:MAG: DUF5009 domain-containing protein [Planctomycetia bacterium]|nr:DUF5009 domain-containing protein [Planctomycetia bacterium]